MIGRIKKVVGEKNYSESPEDLLAYSCDASMLEGNCLAVVWPETTEQVSRIIYFAGQEGLNIVPRGAGTGLAGGAVPQNSIVMDLCRMRRIQANLKEKYAVVEPGVVLDELNSAIEAHNLFFPVVPSSSRVCTVGGMISTNAVGNRAVKYGSMINWLLELEVVDGLGRIHKVTKGFEAFCGTEGIIGVVTLAKLRLTEPIGRTTATLFKSTEISEITSKISQFKSMHNLIALELMDRLMSKLSGLEDKYHLFAEFEGDGGIIQDQVTIKNFWKMRENCGPVLSAHGYLIMEDPLLLDIEPIMRWLEQNQVPYFGHVGVGIIHPRFKVEQKEKISEMLELVKKHKGNVSGEHGIGIAKKSFLDSLKLAELKELKSKYDPNNVLNRGKVL
ncbi:MAG: FAD-binding oxidoreductase [Candidatus Woesearchaeota archaeon]